MKHMKTKNKGNKKKTVINMVDINSTISVVTLNVSAQNAPFKRKRFKEIRNTRPNYTLSVRKLTISQRKQERLYKYQTPF